MASSGSHDPDAILRVVGANIRQRRSDRGWTTGELAERVKIDEPMLARIEEGRTNFELDLLAELADALDTEAYVLVTPPAQVDR